MRNSSPTSRAEFSEAQRIAAAEVPKKTAKRAWVIVQASEVLGFTMISQKV